MPRVLTVPQWSFGRDRLMLAAFRDRLSRPGLTVRFCESFVDQNRTVCAFSGEGHNVVDALLDLAETAFDSIDLNRHAGSHPRIGALDVCPIVPMRNDGELSSESELRPFVLDIAEKLSATYELPVYLYERSEFDGRDSELPALRKGGFGGLLGRRLRPDFGPSTAHERLGIAVVGVRDFLVQVNVGLEHDDGVQARRIARSIRWLRLDGDPRFAGVRALGLIEGTKNRSQVCLSLTMPNLTPIDPIIEYVMYEGSLYGATHGGAELIGAIRPSDLARAERLQYKPEQVVDEAE